MNIEEAIKQCNELINSDIVETIYCAKCEHDCTNECVEEGCLYGKAIETVLEELKLANLSKISCCTAQNCGALTNAIRAELELQKLKENSISRNKIREKIENGKKNLENLCNSANYGDRYVDEIIEQIKNEIDILEELLEESD